MRIPIKFADSLFSCDFRLSIPLGSESVGKASKAPFERRPVGKYRLDSGLDWTGLEWGGAGGGGKGISVFSISFGLLLLIFFGFITKNHPRSIVNTAVFGTISLYVALIFQASIYKLRFAYLPPLTLCLPS